jgi:membrane protein
MALLGAIRGVLHGDVGAAVFLVVTVAATTSVWWFSVWFLHLGEVRGRVLLPTGLVTSLLMTVFVLSATMWMPRVVTTNAEQFGVFGIAVALVTWFTGAAICVLVGACVGPVLAEDTGPTGELIRGREPSTLTVGAGAPLPPPRGLKRETPSSDRRTPEPPVVHPRKGAFRCLMPNLRHPSNPRHPAAPTS